MKIIKIKDGASYQDAWLRRGTKGKEAKEKELLLAKEKAEKEKAKLDAMAAALDKQEALAEEKEHKVTPANRPRLLIGSIRAGENFDKAAKRLGLTRSEIVSIKISTQARLTLNV